MFVVGHPQHRRVALLQQARARAGRPAATVVAYTDLLLDPHALRNAIGRQREVAIKIDSPGEDDDVTRGLVERGWRVLGRDGEVPRARLHGELLARDAWFAGFIDLLGVVERSLGEVAPRWLNPPADIRAMGDKLACQQRFAAAGVAVPELLGTIHGYGDLQERLRGSGHDRVFVKARFGSSAAGVVAYRRHRDGREVLISSSALVREAGVARIVNRLRLQRLDDSAAITALIDALARQGSYAEQWLPKPAVPGRRGLHYDLRVVVTDGRARQCIARMSATPMTNLHLGNRRACPTGWLAGSAMDAIERGAERAAAAFPHSACVGLDLVAQAGGVRVFEANAFGDLLPGVEREGCSTYDDQVALDRMRERECVDA